MDFGTFIAENYNTHSIGAFQDNSQGQKNPLYIRPYWIVVQNL